VPTASGVSVNGVEDDAHVGRLDGAAAAVQLPDEVAILKTVLDQVGAHIFAKDTDGRYTYANRQVCELFGCGLEDIIGRTDADFFDRERSEDLWRGDERALRGERVEVEERNVVLATGETRYYAVVKLPLRDERGTIVGLCGVSTDVTERKLLEANLRAQRDMIELALEHIDAHIYVKDREQRFLYANRRVAELFGVEPSDLIGSKVSRFVGQREAAPMGELDALVFATGEQQAAEEHVTDPGGVEHTFWSVKFPLVWHDGETVLVGFSSDISELRALREELERQTLRDDLTELANRRAFTQRANDAFDMARRYGHELAIIVLDLDHFKQINDAYGHFAGDEVLRAAAGAIRDSLRSVDVVARMGGEEFAVLAPETRLADATHLAERIRAAIAAVRVIAPSGGEIRLAASVGVAALVDHDDRAERVYVRADRAMYRAKEAGRDCVVVAN